MTANFEKEDYDLTIDIDGEGEESNHGEDTHTFEYNESITLEAVSDTGWQFVEWTGYQQSDDKTVSFDMPAEDVTMTANFEKEEYALTIEIDGEGSTYPEEGTHKYEYGTEVDVEATSSKGWYFVRWTGDHESTDNETTINMTEDKEITAVFKEVLDYTLTIDIEGEGSTDPSEGTHTYEEDTQVTLTATPAEDWYFDGWAGDASSTDEQITIIMDENKEITAQFDAPEYTLDVSIEGEGSVDIDPDQASYKHGTEVTINATPAEGWYFEDWSGTDKTGQEITITMDENKSLTAHFDEYVPANFTVEIISQIDGETYYEGETIRIEYLVKNTGELKDTQDVIFSVGDVEEDVEIEVTLEGGDEFKGEFAWEASDPGEHRLEVASEDEEDSITISVEERPEEAYFSITITGYDGQVEVDEEVTIEYTIKNVGELEGTRDIFLRIEDEEEVLIEGLTLESDQEHEDEFVWETDEKGTYEVEVFSEDGSDKVDINVTGLRYELDVDIEGEGKVDLDPEEGEYEEGTEVTLNAVPDEGWYFVEWTGDYTRTEEEITIKMDEDVAVTAHFEEGEPHFEVEITGYDEEVEEGETITLTYTVENTGEVEGTQDIVLVIDDEETMVYEALTLAPGEEYTDEYNWILQSAGEYEIELQGSDTSDSIQVTVESDTTEDGVLANYWWLILIVVVFGGLLVVLLLIAGDESTEGKKTGKPKKLSARRGGDEEYTGQQRTDHGFVDGTHQSRKDVSSVLKEGGEITKDEAYDRLTDEMSYDEFEEELERLVKEEKVVQKPQKDGVDLYEWGRT